MVCIPGKINLADLGTESDSPFINALLLTFLEEKPCMSSLNQEAARPQNELDKNKVL